MRSRQPPSRRDPSLTALRLGKAVEQMAPGSLSGRIANASPYALSTELRAQLRGNRGGQLFGGDRFAEHEYPPIVAGTGVTYELAYVPEHKSENVWVSNERLKRGVQYELEGSLLTLLGTYDADDEIHVHYWRRGDGSAAELATVVDFAAAGWKYSTGLQSGPDLTEGSTAFADPAFDDSAWASGAAAIGWKFGGSGSNNTPIVTRITMQHELWMRREMPGGGYGYVVQAKLDDVAWIYFNGQRLDFSPGQAHYTGNDSVVGGALTGLITVPEAYVLDEGNVVAMHVRGLAGAWGPGDVLVGDMKVTGYRG